jgi:membrane-bound serine protease (ClpP class)
MRSFRHEVRTGEEAMLGARAQVTDWNGLGGHVFVRGERWNAIAPHPLTVGQQVRIVSLDGLTLGVAAEDVEPGETKS